VKISNNYNNTYVQGERVALLVLIFLCFFMIFASPSFFTVVNIINILNQTIIVAIGAIGMTFVIISAGIDLSIGSILGFSSFVALSIHQNLISNVWIAILSGLFVGLFLGFFNGFIITKFKLPPFIVTLCMMISIQGLIPLIGNGSIYNFSNEFGLISKGMIGPIPVPIILLVIVFLLSFIILHNTKIGRFIYAIGNNEKAAILYGIPNKQYKIYAYMFSGFMASLAGLILASGLDAVTTTTGKGYELDVIAAVVLGGTKLKGGEGGVFGSLIGALIIGVVHNGLNLLMINSYTQQIIIGLIILLTVIFDGVSKTKQKTI